MPLLEMLPVQERLSSHLPEVCAGHQCFLYLMKMSISSFFLLKCVIEATESNCKVRGK